MRKDCSGLAGARDHPLRSLLSAEMHMRKLPRFDAPAQIIQIVFASSQDVARGFLRALLTNVPEAVGTSPAKELFYAGDLEGLKMAWEAHSEFCTFTLIAEGVNENTFAVDRFDVAIQRIRSLPGEIIRSTNTVVVGSDSGRADNSFARHFSDGDLVVSEVSNGRARVWSDFRLHNDGFGRMLVEDLALAGAEAVDLLQRLLELGNYRKMALLGLPAAKQAMSRLDEVEQSLADLARTLTDDCVDTTLGMEGLSLIGSELAQVAAATRYRMSATSAYFAIVQDRLATLSPTAGPGRVSLSDFTERRLAPAMRTCEAFSRRLRELTNDTADVSGLLRTRIEDAMAHRNQELLAAMNRRTELQLRLQQTVEGLSIVAITYYAIGIWKALAGDLEGLTGLDLGRVIFVIALSVPLSVWLLLRRIRRLHEVRGPRPSAP